MKQEGKKKDLGLAADMIAALEATNAGYVSVGVGKYYVIVCTDEVMKDINQYFKEWEDEVSEV